MENNDKLMQDLIKEVRRIAEAVTVFKVAFIAFVISALAVLFKNFLM